MTETTITPESSTPAADAAATAPRKTSGGLGGKVLAELQEIAGELGITGADKMRKGALIDAIKIARGDAGTSTKAAVAAAAPSKVDTSKGDAAAAARTEQPAAEAPAESKSDTRKPRNEPKADKSDKADSTSDQPESKNDSRNDDSSDDESGRQGGRNRNQNRNQNQNRDNDGGGNNNRNQNRNDGGGNNRNQNQGQNQGQGGNRNQGQFEDDDDNGMGRRRNRRGRNRNPGGRGSEVDTTYTEDDVLVPAAGILDILDNYAFVRTTGYLPSENDVYVSLSMVRKWGLRRGDAVIGQVRQPREGERKEKFNPMVKIESVNGMTLDESLKRVEFAKLTPLYPSERLRLEGEAGGLTGRVVDLVAPIGKGQRGLIVSPPKAGKTMIMQQVANAITENNPECHLMIVLVDERPEEVTDFQRTVKGEVIASTFDRPATDHTTVAELAIERAKRLVELGHDVVLLLDGITRLGRAYNLAAPTSGRIMSGGVDSSALYPPKKFFGAARNIEDGGSLTILATALVETGSRMDEVIFEEFKGTGNWELRLRRDFADKRIFPAVDVDASSTRREELLMGKDELAVVWKLRRVLSGLEGQQGLELILDKLKKTTSNVEFLMQINTTLPQDGTTNGK
ncbi:transcription termination factor Rho [Aeromicrobium sp. Root236]|uniref:transcription termination factor Rho n=1 Tax=Aeromicrobium sp. Root236 TaxID=1736498 RepID=UPI0006FFC521|nr:transcription termination factor Rho [Aeromicrobium sp. Root236]KRC64401.1 transcription termination factor Rho [Aeromicrobium sp. Root236]